MLNHKKRQANPTKQKTASMKAGRSIETYDVVIIGGGAAGMSAALWCDELQLKTLLLEETEKTGGQLFRVYNPIKNHLGANAKNGLALQKIFLKQIGGRGFTLRTQSAVCKVDVEKKYVILETGEKINWRFLIIATGVRRRKLNVEGEENFKNRGIIESGKRDAKLLKNKSAAIIGGGDAALENALILAETASQITLIHRRQDFRGRAEFLNKIRSNQKIKVLTETAVEKFVGSKKLEAVELLDLKSKKISTLPVEAALIRIGVAPNTEIFRGKLKLDEQGYIKINADCETSVKDIFAVGDAANPFSPTLSTAIGGGATAAKAILKRFAG